MKTYVIACMGERKETVEYEGLLGFSPAWGSRMTLGGLTGEVTEFTARFEPDLIEYTVRLSPPIKISTKKLIESAAPTRKKDDKPKKA